jgi:hypothetical protein
VVEHPEVFDHAGFFLAAMSSRPLWRRMMTTHAWFSAQTALRKGSAVYRKPSGGTVNVTRTDDDLQSKGSTYNDDVYLGPVVRREDGGCVVETRRVPSITG